MAEFIALQEVSEYPLEWEALNTHDAVSQATSALPRIYQDRNMTPAYTLQSPSPSPSYILYPNP